MLNPNKYFFISIFILFSCQEFYSQKPVNIKIPFEEIEKDSLKVIGISDGDSFKVLFQKQELKIRIHGIDAPERKMAFYKNSKKLLASLIFNKYIYLKINKKDHYQRFVAQVNLTNGTNIAYEMVKNGMAWHFTKYSNDKKQANLQELAIKNKIGIWQDENPIPPWDFRKMKRDKIRN